MKGRPPSGSAKSSRLTLRLEEEELQRWRESAKKSGFKLSEWIRDRCLPTVEDVQEVYREAKGGSGWSQENKVAAAKRVAENTKFKPVPEDEPPVHTKHPPTEKQCYKCKCLLTPKIEEFFGGEWFCKSCLGQKLPETEIRGKKEHAA